MAYRMNCKPQLTAGSTVFKKSRRKRPTRGLILLIALGMLALFSLLAVTYVVAAGSSRTGSKSVLVRSRGDNIALAGTANKVANTFIRGTNDLDSPFYQKDLLGDVYGRNAITLRFGHIPIEPPTAVINPYWCTSVGGQFLKVSLDPRSTNSVLSPNENEYNSRLLTVLEGPLAGQTFRILKYVGYVRHPDNATSIPTVPSSTAGTDVNFAQLFGGLPVPPATRTVPWAAPAAYSDPVGSDIDYSVLIDLSEIQGDTFTGQFTNAVGGVENVTRPLAQWLATPSSLFFYNYPTVGYKCVINDAAFNSPGIGVQDDVAAVGFGGIDGRHIMNSPGLPLGIAAVIPPALLTDYKDLNNLGLVTMPIPGIGVPRTSPTQTLLNGGTNEGIDVPDWRDPWLAHQSVYWSSATSTWVNNVIPSMHRPEVVHYIAGIFGDPSSLNAAQVGFLLRLIDASSSRVMSYTLGGVSVNPNFRSDDSTYPRYSAGWSSPPTQFQIDSLRAFVANQINGGWDFDNDGDGVNDSIIADAGMPATSGPNGKLLKPVMALLAQDMDGRLNVNVSGDRIQGRGGYPAGAGLAGYKRIGELISQGSGYGPADISLNGVLNHVPALITNPVFQVSGTDHTTFSFFDDRYGARRYSGRLRNMSEDFLTTVFSDPGLDRMPGRRATTLPNNDWVSQRFEREASTSGYSGRRSSVGATFDVNGNLVFVPPTMDDANPTAPFAVAAPSETEDDPYDSSPLAGSSGDDPFSIADLESLLRRYDTDANSLPSRLKERLLQDPRNRRTVGDTTSPYDVNKLLLDSEVLKQLTVRSVELTHPKLGAAFVETNGTASVTGIKSSPTSFVDFIKMLHKQRYQNRSAGTFATNDPELNTAAMCSLFPIDFARGLRMDLNRPFGNGLDNDVDGQVDEPQEIAYWLFDTINNPNGLNEPDAYVSNGGGLPAVGSIEGRYGREVAPAGAGSTRVRLSSRQAFARSLYCLGQLIIPRSYQFPAMTGMAPGSFDWYRARATAIAQWAINVVDFRDTDAAMTRFEFDIFPFGIGTMPAGSPIPPPATGPCKLPFWAPDYVQFPAYSVPKEYCGVVWGMEMPELLLTESIALHDKMLRDTDAEAGGHTTTDPMTQDDDFDQYRFPLASLFLELYCPRSATSPTSLIIPGAPSSLYELSSDGTMKLQIGKTVSSPAFGVQPVWRIGISNHYDRYSMPPSPPVFHPNIALQSTPDSMHPMTNQFSTAADLAGTATGTPDSILGSGLYHDLSSMGATPPALFDRMVWFTGYSGQTVPNLVASDQGNRVYYNRSTYSGANVATDGTPLMAGGSYLVVGPRAETPIGSLKNNPFTGVPWSTDPLKSEFLKGSFTTAASIPIRSPSHQSISLLPNSVSTFMLDGTAAESVWLPPVGPGTQYQIRPAIGMVCGTNPPDDPAVLPNASTPTGATEWTRNFPTGVGLNISLPTPRSGPTLWAETYRPRLRLNDDDENRPDGSLGFGDKAAAKYFPPDSWVRVDGTSLPATVTGALFDRPFDYPDPTGAGPVTLNPVLNPDPSAKPNVQGMYDSGTYQNVRVAYLQRLADPEFGYDPITNPYITVDWISIDLTVFNGEAPPSPAPAGPPSGGDPHNTTTQVATISLQSRYKDGDVATITGKAAIATSTLPSPSLGAGQPGSAGAGGLTYHSPSTAQLRTTATQPAPTAASRYPSYLMHQIGYASPRTIANPGSSATSLGYLNVGYRASSLATSAQNANDTSGTYDGFGPPRISSDPALYGAATNMTSVAWLNRPFASPHELMLVPLTGPGQFGFYHSVFSDDSDHRHPFRFLPSFQTMNAWRIDNPTSATNDFDQMGYWAQPNFQTMRAGGSTGEYPTPTPVEADWPLLLEFVETRPPFADAHKVYNPNPIVTAMNPSYPAAPPVDAGGVPSSATIRSMRFADRFLDSRLRSGYMSISEPEVFLGPSLRSPFNMSSSFRAVGKVNLNTIAPERNVDRITGVHIGTPRSSVLKGLEYNYLVGSDRDAGGYDTDSADPLTDQFMNTRRGYLVESGPGPYSPGHISPFFASASNPNIAPHLNSYYPTQFVGAYRSPLTSNLAPYVQNGTARAKMRSKFGVETTLARSFSLADQDAATLPSPGAPSDAMLFSPSSVNGGPTGSVTPTPTATLDAERNAYTRLQREMRLPNLITNQSNVFAVWVTVMLYEYDPVTGFGNEYLDENGLPKRERMFYIIDRSIPVGYKPGENLNTDRTILLKRKLD